MYRIHITRDDGSVVAYNDEFEALTDAIEPALWVSARNGYSTSIVRIDHRGRKVVARTVSVSGMMGAKVVSAGGATVGTLRQLLSIIDITDGYLDESRKYMTL